MLIIWDWHLGDVAQTHAWPEELSPSVETNRRAGVEELQTYTYVYTYTYIYIYICIYISKEINPHHTYK